MPPFHRVEKVTEDAIGSRNFAGYALKKHLLKVQQAILIFNLNHR
jgi:ornithine carbamoyltransferase